MSKSYNLKNQDGKYVTISMSPPIDDDTNDNVLCLCSYGNSPASPVSEAIKNVALENYPNWTAEPAQE